MLQLKSSKDSPNALSAAQSGLIIGACVAAAAIHILAEFASSRGDDFALSRAMGGFVATLLFTGLIAGVVYFFTRKRSRWPAAITACVLLVALSGLTSIGLVKRTSTAAIWRDMDRINAQTLAELQAISESSGSAAEYRAVMERHTAALSTIASKLSGREQVMARVGASFSSDVTTIMSEYLSTLTPFRTAGGLKPETLKDKAAVTKRRAALKPAIVLHTTILASFRQIPPDLHNRFVKFGSTDRDTTRAEQGMLAGMHFSQLLRVHELENRMLVAMDEHLAALEASSSKWTSQNGLFQFNDQKALDAFNQRVHALQDLVQQQTAAQQQIFASRR